MFFFLFFFKFRLDILIWEYSPRILFYHNMNKNYGFKITLILVEILNSNEKKRTRKVTVMFKGNSHFVYTYLHQCYWNCSWNWTTFRMHAKIKKNCNEKLLHIKQPWLSGKLCIISKHTDWLIDWLIDWTTCYSPKPMRTQRGSQLECCSSATTLGSTLGPTQTTTFSWKGIQ